MVQEQIILDNKSYIVHRDHSFSDQTRTANSQLLVCPKCGRVWAYLILDGTLFAWPVAQSCESCGAVDNWMPVPGSLLVEEGWGTIDDSLLAALPEDLVRREFKLHLKAYGDKRCQVNQKAGNQTTICPISTSEPSGEGMLEELGSTKMEASASGSIPV